jgi:hypothetical protein
MPLPAASEEPVPVELPVFVEVADRHDDPAVVDFVLGPAVHRSGGMLGVYEVDAMAADLVDGSTELPDRGFGVPAERVVPEPISTDLHVGHEQRDPGVEVAAVDGHGVADRQLADGEEGLDPFDPVEADGVGVHSTWCRQRSRTRSSGPTAATAAISTVVR